MADLVISIVHPVKTEYKAFCSSSTEQIFVRSLAIYLKVMVRKTQNRDSEQIFHRENLESIEFDWFVIE